MAQAVDDPGTAAPSASGFASWYALAVFVAATLFGFVDRQVFILMAEPIRQAFSLSDTQLGMLQGLGIALFAAIAGYPIAWIADRTDRKLVLVVCILIWSGAVVACAFAPNFLSLLVASAIVGAGEAGLAPIVYALIPQLFAGAQRPFANAVYAISTRLGIGLALWFCSLIIVSVDGVRAHLPAPLADLETWRLALIGSAAPALIIVPMLLAVRIPKRAIVVAPAQRTDAPSRSAVLQHVLSHRQTLLGFFLGMGFAAFGFASIISWVPVIVGRMYGVTPVDAGAATGTATLAATIIGFFLSVGCQRLFAQRLGPSLPIVFLWVSSLLGAATSALLVFARGPVDIYVLQGVQMASAIIALMIVPTAMQDIAPPAIRSRIISINGICMIVLGALSPVAVGALSDAIGEQSNALLLAAVAASTAGLVIAALLFLWSARTYAATAAAALEADE